METLDYAPPSRSLLSAFRYSRSAWAILARAVFCAGVLLIAFIAAAGMLFVLSLSPIYAVLVTGICVGAVVHILHELRLRWARRVLFHIEAAVRTNLPLTDYLYVAASAESRFVRRRLMAIAELLQTGAPLAAAIPSGAPELSSHESRLIYAGERTGRLPQMLSRLMRTGREKARLRMTSAFLYRWYLPVAGITVIAVAAAIVIFVMPKFETILRDFNVSTPWAMTIPIRFFRDYWWLAVAAVFIPGIVWAVLEVVDVVLPTNAGLEKRRWKMLLGRIPVLGALSRNRSLADICWILAADVRAGIPLTDSIQEIAALPLDGDLNVRADNWRSLLNDGHSPAAAARQAEMPELICCILNAPGDAEGLAGSLETAGDLFDNRQGRVQAIVDSITVPAVVLLLAGVALMLALSIFVPIMRMVDYLIQPIGVP